ncbi:MAG: hypothetical protein ACLGHJ_06820 [Gammaproteobacteria bacterium]
MTRALSMPLAVLLALLPGATATAGEEPAAQLQALEARLAQLEAARAAPVVERSTESGKFRFNGFLSAGAGRADIDDFFFDGRLGEDVSHTADSVVGLQIEAEVNDRTTAMLQLAARGSDDFAASAEWAYVSWRPTDGDEFRAGRLRAPFYVMSEYLEVGYVYPWARPPIEVYKPTFPSSLDGVSWSRKFNAGAWQHDLYAHWGSTAAGKQSPVALDITDGWEVAFGSAYHDWQFGLKVNGARLNAENRLFAALARLGAIDPLEDVAVLYQSAGVQYDNGKLLALAEGTMVRADGFVPDTESVYATLGYRFGKLMPHLTWASTRTTDEEERPALPLLADQGAGPASLCPATNPNPDASLCLAILPDQSTPLDNTDTVGVAFPADTLARLLESDQTSVTLGIRYDFLANAALKFDWTRVLDTHGTFGMFTHERSNLLPTTVLPDEEVDIFRVAVDVVF